ncbi:MAG TPA: cellulase family glycosylhydrolase [Cyclobacteriaceae bacterium]|nr:cellulase family glycosylhydrolase [Cyclobacteriaceae bacterium]
MQALKFPLCVAHFAGLSISTLQKSPLKKTMYSLLSVILLLLIACSEDETNALTVDKKDIEFSVDGGNVNIIIQTDAKAWSIDNPASDWLTITPPSGNLPTTTVNLKVTTRTLTPRAVTLIVSAGNADPVQVEVTQPSSDFLYTITADAAAFEFKHIGETKSLKIATDAPQWTISSDADWLQFSKTTGIKGTTTINVTALESTPDPARTATISISGTDAGAVQIPVTQVASVYPTYNTSPIAPDATGMDSDVVQLASKMHLGWNIGNTLEAIGGETAWGNPKITKAFVDAIKNIGFNAIRLPCSWDQNSDATTAKIDQVWLDRVKEVIQYCVDNDMYVLLNIHWDGGWLENNITPEKKDLVNAKQKAFWEQIATHLRDFDEHLMFASANEPNADNESEMAVLYSYHQTFVNAVRATGGRNSYRVLVVQGASALMNTFPTDEIPNRIMYEEHYYTPFQFTLLSEDVSWGNMFYYWGEGNHSTIEPSRNSTWGEEAEAVQYFEGLKTKFVDKGIPVLMGEYLAALRSNTADPDKHIASRDYWLKFITKTALENGVIPFVWDTGGLVNRNTGAITDQRGIDSILEGGN